MKKYLEQTLGQEKADLRLDHCRLVNVLSGRIEEDVSIAIAGERVVGVGNGYCADKVVDVGGKFVYPGLIDAHIHLESCKLRISEISRQMVRHGTSAVVTDPHEIANVAGLDGVAFQLDSARDTSLMDVFFTAPSCVPAIEDRAVETYGASLDAEKMRMLAGVPEVVALGEMMNVPGVLMGNPEVYAKIQHFRSQKLCIDGHAPLLSGPALNACIAAGVMSDHESTALAEAQEKLDRGMFVMIREGSCERNLEALWPLINAYNAGRIMFASDDLDPVDMSERGHIDHILRRIVAKGIHAIQAIQMATLSPANYFHLEGHGAIYPGSYANLVIAPNLVDFEPECVIHRGREVYSKNAGLSEINETKERFLRNCMNLVLPTVESLKIPFVAGKKARVLTLVPQQILTLEEWYEPRELDGAIATDETLDIAKAVVFERHRGTGAFGVCLVRGFGIKRGAIGSSVAHDSHNVIVVGMNDEDIWKVAERIRDLGGAQVAVCGNECVEMPLPIAGLMSRVPAQEVVAQEKSLNDFMHSQLGVSIARPMAALSFMSLPVIPHLRITDQGILRVMPGAYPKVVDVYES